MRPMRRLCVMACAMGLFVGSISVHGQNRPAPPAATAPGGAAAVAKAPDPSKPQKLVVTSGKARYRVREQLVGINFPNDAVGQTDAVTGTLVVNPDGTLDVAHSKITVDLRTLTSDQQMRDGYVQTRTLETAKFPMMEFVPKRVVGLTGALPATGQAGFQLVGDLTLRGVTSEATWNVIVTFANDGVAGRATTSQTFDGLKLTKPSLARLMSVDDKIELEIDFRTARSAL